MNNYPKMQHNTMTFVGRGIPDAPLRKQLTMNNERLSQNATQYNDIRRARHPWRAASETM